MEEHQYTTTFILSEDDAALTATCGADSRRHCHVHFTYEIVGLESYEDSHTLCVFSDLLHAPEEQRHDLFWEELATIWPIDDEAIIHSIADAVIARVALQSVSSVRVDIRTTAYDEVYDDALDNFPAAAEPVVSLEVIQMSLKRKRVEECGEEGVVCSICLDGVSSGAEVAVMPCNHSSFHLDCLFTWLHRNRSCPLCRRQISVCDS
ncbi:unnamed protein product [Cuscuta europaea]|uniref:RING-type domain-containing protein n=1 Tax=Cuscuta europaea TaxID=41803 RepID=A0A9P0ZKN9_CUSEU|nr:unnamed protein product [Cuscuta europaea]